MTLQIVSLLVEGEARIELHGWLTGPEIAEFQTACASQAPPFSIDLQNLSGASTDGIMALKEQRARGARLMSASPYIELLLKGSSSAGHGKSGRGPGIAS